MYVKAVHQNVGGDALTGTCGGGSLTRPGLNGFHRGCAVQILTVRGISAEKFEDVRHQLNYGFQRLYRPRRTSRQIQN